jgi:drug/metabolite transporter (DMT)-like permease
MGLIAPLTALIGAGVPAAVGMIAGESVSTFSLVGIVVALIAVVLISLPSAPSDAGERRALRIDVSDLPLVVVAGLGFAGFFLLLDRAVAAGGSIWWSLVFVRVAGLAMVLVAVAVVIGRASGPSVRARAAHVLGTPRLRLVPYGMAGVIPLFALAGAGDFGGNAFFVLANEQDSLPVAVVLSSLYPVVTTALAVMFLHERLRPIQLVGVVLAIVGVTLISAGDALAPGAEAASSDPASTGSSASALG